jgi:hypothetical protein
MLADLVGRGYTGQHRLAGVQTAFPARVDLLPRQRAVADAAVSPVPSASLVPSVSPVPSLVPDLPIRSDRFADTAPHPVVKLFPMPVEPAAGEGVAERSNTERSNAERSNAERSNAERSNTERSNTERSNATA